MFLKVKKTKKVKDSLELKNKLTNIIQRITLNIPLNIKKELVKEKINDNYNYLLIFHCDPMLNINNKNDKYEYLTDLNEYEYLKYMNTIDSRNGGYDNTFGVGGNTILPITSICDMDILCNNENRKYKNENILIHEFAHAIMDIGMYLGDRSKYNKIIDIYNNQYKPTIKDCSTMYSCLSPFELWAESTQSWFNATRRTDVDENIENVNNIKNNYPQLYQLLSEVYGEPYNICKKELKYCSPLC